MASVNAWPWATPEATRQGIAARLRERYPRSELQLRQVEVGFRRLLVRLERADPGRRVINGGIRPLEGSSPAFYLHRKSRRPPLRSNRGPAFR